MTTLGTDIAGYLKKQGVDVVFGIPGVHNVELYRGLEAAGITHVLARHEQGAGFMADGYARATGKPGVAFVITGPGVTNIMTPMGQAYSDSVPMLVISSCLPPEDDMPGRLHQMRDQVGAGACVCDWSQLASDAQRALELLDRAFAEFKSERRRPKHMTVPIDVLAGPGWQGHRAATPKPPVTADVSSDLQALADQLDRSSRPLFIFGGGAKAAWRDGREVLERSGGAAFVTYAGRGVIDSAHAMNFGPGLARSGSVDVLKRADLVIVVGSELAEVDIWRSHLGHEATLARIDIDPDVVADAHGAQIRIVARAEDALRELKGMIAVSTPKWDQDYIREKRAAFRSETDTDRPGIVPFVDAMAGVLPPDIQIFSDMTQFAYVAKETYPLSAPGLWHHPYGFGTLGYALPAAVGACLGASGEPVVAIAGDYGFQYTLQELGVAAELALPLVLVLWDNGRLKEIEDCMVRSQIRPNAVVAQNPDFSLLAASYGIAYEKADAPDAFAGRLAEALKRAGPTMIHVGPAESRH